MEQLIILDFETIGLSPRYSRVIEVGALLIKGDKIVKRLSQLMDPGFSIPYFITDITGITNKMVKGQPKPEEFMPVLKRFIGRRPILAHNATFDQRFLASELAYIGKQMTNPFLCSLKLSRRLIPYAPNHKLSTLIQHLKIKMPKDHQSHRVLHDVLSTFHLWLYIKKNILHRVNVMDLAFFSKLSNYPRSKVRDFLAKHERGSLCT
jgi:DNA polymerase III subunit epsilon